MKKMSDLYKGAYFSFSGEKTVYHVQDIVYSGNRNGDFSVKYYNTNSNADFIWTTKNYDSAITIYYN